MWFWKLTALNCIHCKREAHTRGKPATTAAIVKTVASACSTHAFFVRVRTAATHILHIHGTSRILCAHSVCGQLGRASPSMQTDTDDDDTDDTDDTDEDRVLRTHALHAMFVCKVAARICMRAELRFKRTAADIFYGWHWTCTKTRAQHNIRNEFVCGISLSTLAIYTYIPDIS